jgi:4-amino-4-deoxy-L-arabinose transferase-like glycosyltransferase
MRPKCSLPGFIWLILALLALSFFVGIDRVPFHPDETSWLAQSQDFERYASGPGRMAFSESAQVSAEMSYRLLNAPAAKYVLALGRRISGFPASAIPRDWDWTASWATNLERGAIPDEGVLRAARLASTTMVALSLIPLFLVGRRIGGLGTGLLAAGLLAVDALALLHGRRAMAEGTLILSVTMVMAGVLWADRYPWLTGLSLGFALATKQSTLPLLPIGLLGVAWSPGESRRIGWRLAICCLAILGVWLILNPVAWRQPSAALSAMAVERNRLVGQQVADFRAQGGTQVIDAPGERLAALIAAAFFSPPQVREAANYDLALGVAQAAYLASPRSQALRGIGGGAAMLLLTLLGIAFGVRRVLGPDQPARRDSALLLLLTLAQVAGLLVAVPLAFQRYYVPLVPIFCLWSALALAVGFGAIRGAVRGKPGRASA